MKKILVLAQHTVQTYARDRLFHAVLLFALLLVLFSFYLASLSFVENRKILLDFGLGAVSLIGVGFALVLGSLLLRKEMDNRTVYTLLSKPVHRGEYLLGRYLGGVVVLALAQLICAAALAVAMVGSGDALPPGFGACLYLTILESCLVLAFSVALSLWSSSLFLSAALSLALFLVGRSNYSFIGLGEKASGLLRAIYRGLYAVLPALQRFDIRDVVAYGKPYPPDLLATSTLYGALYLAASLLAGYLLLRRKDLP